MANNTISDEIATAFNGPQMSSREIQDLLERARPVADQRREEAMQARERALDPVLNHSGAASAYQNSEQLAFEADRLKIAVERLEQLACSRAKEEDQEQKMAVFERARQARDKTAERLSKEFPKIQKQLLMLIKELVVTSAQVTIANEDLPDEMERLEKPEAYARRFFEAAKDPHAVHGPFASITEMVVPDFNNPLQAAWPPGHNRHPGSKNPDLKRLEFLFREGELTLEP